MSADIESIGKDIVDAAYKVHKEFGPGLLESAYQACHVYELRKRGRIVQTELILPIEYDGQKFDEGYRIDELVDGLVIVENKAIDEVHPIPYGTTSYIYEAQEHQARLSDKLERKACQEWNPKSRKWTRRINQSSRFYQEALRVLPQRALNTPRKND